MENPSKTRCKFKCDSISDYGKSNRDPNRRVRGATFSPVYGDSPENKAFFEATPTGKLELNWTTDVGFEPGKEYYIDIVPAN